MCAFVEERQTTALDLVRTDWVWREEEDAEARVPPDLEAWQLMRQGLLDQVEDPDAGEGAASDGQEAGGEAGEEPQEDEGREDAGASDGSAGQAHPGPSEQGVIEDSAQESGMLPYDNLEEDDYLSIGGGSQTGKVRDDWMVID